MLLFVEKFSFSRWGVETAIQTKKVQVSEQRIVKSDQSIREGLGNLDLWKHLSPKEGLLLKNDLGTWTPAETHFYSNGWESIGMLLWALNISETPNLDNWTVPVNPASLFFMTGLSLQNPASLTRWLEKDRELRDPAEIFRARSVGEAWHWRVRASFLRKIKEDPNEQIAKMPAGVRTFVRNIDLAIGQATARAEADKLIPYTVDDDFPVDERPFADLTEEEATEIGDVTNRRLSALGWLFSQNDWDIDPADVKYANSVPSIWVPEE